VTEKERTEIGAGEETGGTVTAQLPAEEETFWMKFVGIVTGVVKESSRNVGHPLNNKEHVVTLLHPLQPKGLQGMRRRRLGGLSLRMTIMEGNESESERVDPKGNHLPSFNLPLHQNQNQSLR
jgi:hypothetical protein